MSFWTRMANVFRGDRLNREITDELESHIGEAVAAGRNEREARRAMGTMVRHREESHQARVIGWLDSLRADVIFGWRQLKRNKVTSAAAILSLALATGACTAAFRLIEALFLRPLPVAQPGLLYVLSRTGFGTDGKLQSDQTSEYPLFLQMRAAVRGQAELMAVSFVQPVDLTFQSDEEMEKAHLQYVSGWMFSTLGIKPVLGRTLLESDDNVSGGHPYALISYDYWTRRFGRDPHVIGRAFRMGSHLYEIVGVSAEGFTGTEPGNMADVFVPATMHAGLNDGSWGWLRIFVQFNHPVAVEPVQEKLRATLHAFLLDQVRNYPAMPKDLLQTFLRQNVSLERASAGVSRLQRNYGLPLVILCVLVAMVLLIACANVANLMTAQAAARAREMALRISLGAGRLRLVRMVLVESVLLALFASTLGAIFAWWSAPFVVRMIHSSENPVRLTLSVDWRVLAFGCILTLGIILLLGLAPALRASATQPVNALKGGDDPHARQRTMHGLIAMQTAFCFLVLFIAGLFVTTFTRISAQPTGFSAEGLLLLNTVAQRGEPFAYWDQVVEDLRGLSGVKSVALAGFPLLSGERWNGTVAVGGGPPGPDLSYFLDVSPGWMDTMRIPLLEGRDLRAADTYPGAAIVNVAFAKQYFHGEDPVGKSFDRVAAAGKRIPLQIVGLVQDACYGQIRDQHSPVAYVSMRWLNADGSAMLTWQGTFVIRTIASDPLLLAPLLRREISRIRPEFRGSSVQTQNELVRSQTIRERLLATLAAFFATLALLLAGIGLFGVLNYSVLRREREIGIRLAVGASIANIARVVTERAFLMLLLGAAVGGALGLAASRYVQALLYGVKGGDVTGLALPAFVLFIAAMLAALPVVIKAARIDPATMLRAE